MTSDLRQQNGKLGNDNFLLSEYVGKCGFGILHKTDTILGLGTCFSSHNFCISGEA